MTIKTADENIDDLLTVLGPGREDIISQGQLDKAMQAVHDHDSTLAAVVLSELFDDVARKAAGLQLDKLDGEAYGRKIGWLTNCDKERTRKTVLDYLAKYKRELAIKPMEQAIQCAYTQGTVSEVVREAQGETCDWCLQRCGVWAPIDANAYGVWARHAGCDCKIYVRRTNVQ